MNRTRARQPLHLSELVDVSAKFSVVLMFSFMLVGCGDDKAPSVQWFIDNPSEIDRTLRSCSYSTKYNPMPHYTWCDNARSASHTMSMRLRDLEEEKQLAAARDTPENLRTVRWYEGNRQARQAKLKECKVSAGKGDVEFDHSCFKATRAGMNQYVSRGPDVFGGDTMAELVQILRAVSPLPTTVPPNPRRHREVGSTALEQAVPARKYLPGLEPQVLHERGGKEVVAPPYGH